MRMNNFKQQITAIMTAALVAAFTLLPTPAYAVDILSNGCTANPTAAVCQSKSDSAT